MALKPTGPGAWRPPPEDDRPPCAHETCSSMAWVKIRTKNGWAALCMTHYELHFSKQGDAAHTAAGLDRMQDESRADWKKRVFAHWRELVKRAPMNRKAFEAVQHDEPEKEIAFGEEI